MTHCIMIQGTGSGVGKSVIATAWCRYLKLQGYQVAPFKAFNMALNSGVTLDGLEMGRAQIVQAEAAGLSADVRMNPLLLKPQGAGHAQLIREGRVVATTQDPHYAKIAAENWSIVKNNFASLSKEFDWIVIEGAGSPAEINLQDSDFVNMRMAYYAQARVLIVGDIDRGGVFAWLKGTYDLIQPQYRPWIEGFLINKFRGQLSLLQAGIEQFKAITPCPILGVLPYHEILVEEEDSVFIHNLTMPDPVLKIAVILLPCMSNFTDFAAFKYMKRVNLIYTLNPNDLIDQDMLILPGSKSTLHDMRFLETSGLAQAIRSIAGKIPILGICGGLQLLGSTINDPLGLEGEIKQIAGLGLLNLQTELKPTKVLHNTTYRGAGFFQDLSVKGYQMHCGKTLQQEGQLEQLFEDPELGYYHQGLKILATYLHGIFNQGEVASRIFQLTGKDLQMTYDFEIHKDHQYNELSQWLSEHCELERIIASVKHGKRT